MRVVRFYDLEEFIAQVYGQTIEIPPDQECGNDTVKQWSFKQEAKLDKYSQESLDKWLSTGRFNYTTSVIIQDLVNKGLIPAGDYIIDISW